MQKRYEYAAKRTAEFMKRGITIFCPINHCHPIAEKHDMPRTWEFWKNHDLDYIRAAEGLWVLDMPHWKESTGITAEILYGLGLGRIVTHVDCSDYSED